MTDRLHTFHGGIHPEEHKTLSTTRPIAQAPIPARLIVPVRQHIGEPARPCVSIGEKVRKGQIIAQADGYVSLPAHAPTSGIVTAIAPHPVPHPSGLSDLCIHIEPDGQDIWIEHDASDYQSMHPSTLRNLLRDMGIAGLGGAVFPTFAKLNPGKAVKIPTLLLNGGECEPWITCDDMVMRERANDILRGAAIMRHLLQSDEILVGIEDNKPQAIAAMRAAAQQSDIPARIITIPTLYPSGGAKQLIKIITGREVPSGGRSTDIGVATFNVGTALAVHRAVNLGEPMVSRVITVTGNVGQAQNFDVMLGTPMQDLIALTGSSPEPISGVIMGGPMMGIEITDLHAPAVKATNCILVKSSTMFPPPPPAMECIRCTRCAEACPAELQPQALYWFARSKHFDKAREHALFDCIECGCCSYVCPSHIPLVQYYRFAKSEIAATEANERASNLARQRHDARTTRLEREARERAERLAQKSAAKPVGDEAKQAAIDAAIARAQAQQPTNE